MNEQPLPEQNQPPHEASKKERREMRREEKRREQEKAKNIKGRKNALVWIAVLLAVLGVGFGVFKFLTSPAQDAEASILKTCINHTGVGMHIHPDLRIVVGGEEEKIPANIGISGNCMRPLHAHDGTGKLHVEFPRPHNFTLGDFFKVWDKQFSGTMTMTVNGEPNTEYERYVLKDHDQIEIRYEEKQAGEGL